VRFAVAGGVVVVRGFFYLFLTLFAFIIDRTDAFAFALLGVHIFDPDA
jgi:hypothetical protein